MPGRPEWAGLGLVPAAPLKRAGPRARSKKRLGTRSAVPLPGAGRRARPRGGGARTGSARGGVPAGARTRGCGARRGARAANPLLAPPAPPARAGPGRRVRGEWGSRGGAAPCPRPLRARPGALGGLVGIPGTAETLPSPRNRGARHAGTTVTPGRSRWTAGPVGALLPPSSVPSSPGPPYPLPRPDPAAKGWAGKRALWDRCQLRDKRHKIGGNGGSAAGALGRGRRSRGGSILGADRRKFGKSPQRLRSGGGRAGRAALRAALTLSAPLLNNSWRGRRPLACTGRAARLCQAAAAAAFGARAAPDERQRGGRARAVPVPARWLPLCPGPRHRAAPTLFATHSAPDGRALQVRARGTRPTAPGCT